MPEECPHGNATITGGGPYYRQVHPNNFQDGRVLSPAFVAGWGRLHRRRRRVAHRGMAGALGCVVKAPPVPRQLYLPVGVNQFCRFTSSAWPRFWDALVR